MYRYLLVIAAVTQLYAQPKGLPHVPLPADLQGQLDGTPYGIRVPANWNGTLLVYAHGSMSGGLEIVPPTDGTSTLEEQLLSAGYALAGSFYNDSEKEGPKKTLALTNFFKGMVGNPRRTIVWGMSLGGDTALALIEDHPGVYDGAIPVGAEAGGFPRYADFLLRYDLAYAAVFGWPSDSWGPIEDLRDDLYENTDTLVFPAFAWDGSFGQWEFVRLVMKLSSEAWWGSDIPGWILDGWAGTAKRSHLEDMYGGPVAQNVGVVYGLTEEEKAYLVSLGVDAEGLLNSMNAHTNITAQRSARELLSHYATPSGKLRHPALMMQGTYDPIVIPSNQAVYRDMVNAQGFGDNLTQVYVKTWHGPFSTEQYRSALAAMEHWLETGSRPDASFFPESQGFDNSFVPQPWPY